MKWYTIKGIQVDEETLDKIQWWIDRQGFCVVAGRGQDNINIYLQQRDIDNKEQES